MQARERLQDFPKQQLVDDALQSIIMSIHCLQRQSIPDRSIPTDVQRLWLYTTVKTFLILPTTVLEQTMNNMKQCIMKSTLVIIFVVMKSVVTLLNSSFCQAAMHCRKLPSWGPI